MPAKSVNSKYSLYHVCPECDIEWKSQYRNEKVNHYCDAHKHLYKNKNTGSKRSPETRRKISQTRIKKFANGELNHKGENAPCWKGGRRMKNGRVMFLMPEHPGSDKAGYIHEYRLRAEKALGRPLETHEVVHHFNNEEDNLMICTQPYHMWLHNKMKGGD